MKTPLISPAVFVVCVLSGLMLPPPVTAFMPEPWGAVECVAVRHPGTTNEQYFVGGAFTHIGGLDTESLVLLNFNGTVDRSFQVTFAPAHPRITAVCWLPNDTLLVAGSFTSVHGLERPGLVQLNATDGGVRPGFMPGDLGGAVYCLQQLSPGGSIAVGGAFGLKLLDLENGSLLLEHGDNQPVYSLAHFQPYGQDRYYIGGDFPGGVRCLKRHLTEPRLVEDDTFNRGGTGFFSLSGTPAVRVVKLIRGNAALMVGGAFDGYNNRDGKDWYRANLVELLVDPLPGTMVDDFIQSNLGPSGEVTGVLELGPDFLIAGRFAAYGGVPVGGLCRIGGNGALDSAYNRGQAGFDGAVVGLVPAANSNLLVYGWFSTYNGTNAPSLVRLDAQGQLDLASPAPRPPGELSLPVWHKEVAQGARARLEVPAHPSARGFPADSATVIWRRNGQTIDPGPNPWAYDIPSISPEDYGTYEVEMSNELGNGTVQFILANPTTPQFVVHLPFPTVTEWSGGIFLPLVWGPAVEEPMDIELSLDNGGSWLTVAAALTGFDTYPQLGERYGYHNVFAPNVASDQFKVRVRRTGASEGAGEWGPLRLNRTAPTRSEAWRQQHFGTTDNVGEAADDADPDGDTVVNLFEYLFGTDPRNPHSRAAAKSALINGQPQVLFPSHYQAVDVSYAVEISSAFGPWTEVWSSLRFPREPEHQVPFPETLGAHGFARLKVTRPAN